MRDWHARSEWTGYWPSFSSFGRLPDGVAIHHTANGQHPATFDPAHMRNLEQGEMASGYSSLAYHTVVFDDGSLAESRPYWAVGAATGGHNAHTIAFCYAGYFHPPYNHVPSERALRAVADEVRRLVDQGQLDPGYVMLGHRDWTAGTQWATACPGDVLYPRVADINAWAHRPPEPDKPPPTKVKKMDCFIAWANYLGVHCYLVRVLDGRVVHAYPQKDIGAYGFPQDVLRAFEKGVVGVELTQPEWRSIIDTGHMWS